MSQSGLHYSIKVGRLTDFDTAKTYTACTKKSLQLVATVEDGAIKLFTLPHPENVGDAIERKTRVESPAKDYCLVRILRYGSMDQICASDFGNNIHFFDLPLAFDFKPNFLQRPKFTIFNAHAKLITDIQFIAIAVPAMNDTDECERL